MIVAWLRLRVDIGLVGIILFFRRIGGVRKVRPQQCGHGGSLTVSGDVNWASRGHLACHLNKNAVLWIFKKQERSQSKTENVRSRQNLPQNCSQFGCGRPSTGHSPVQEMKGGPQEYCQHPTLCRVERWRKSQRRFAKAAISR